jgi:uncharacterized membrane protein YgcG
MNLVLALALAVSSSHADIVGTANSNSAWALKQALATHRIHSNDAHLEGLLAQAEQANPQCQEFEPMFSSYVKYHRAAIKSLRSQEASAGMSADGKGYKYLILGRAVHGMGNRFQAYVSVLLLAMLSNYVFLMDEQAINGSFQMADFFEGSIDWAADESKKALLQKHCTEVEVDTTTGTILKDAISKDKMSNVWPTKTPILGGRCAAVKLEDIFNGQTGFLPGTYFLLTSLGGLGGDGDANPHFVAAMKTRTHVKNPSKMSWCAVGCLSNVLFRPKKVLYDSVRPVLQQAGKDGDRKRMIAQNELPAFLGPRSGGGGGGGGGDGGGGGGGGDGGNGRSSPTVLVGVHIR